MDNIMLQIAMPRKKIITVIIFRFEIFPARYNQYPIIKFSKPHNTFTVGEDKPIPAGWANGVGKELPQIPCTK